ncbi:MAG: hypothetical protein F6K39_00535 [Okeania sp. SIO3B3]|nr:hypothetical protein [Okeania sp. SIO3B3]
MHCFRIFDGLVECVATYLITRVFVTALPKKIVNPVGMFHGRSLQGFGCDDMVDKSEKCRNL